MKYINGPRWRYLLLPFVLIPGVFIALAVTGISLGCVAGMRAWMDLMGWCHYE